MAASITKQKLSGSTNGRNIKVAATATAGTTLHTADATAFDEIYLWCVNSETEARKLVIEFGGVSAPDDLIEQMIPPESGLFPVVPGLLVTGGVVVRAFAPGGANVLCINGFVNRITNS